MISLKDFGYKDYYYLYNDKIYNSKSKKYLKLDNQNCYTLINKDNKKRHIGINKLLKSVYGKFYAKDNIKDLPNEEWKRIENSKGYSISNYGRVKSFLHLNTKLLEKDIVNGYERVCIDIGYGFKNYYIHKLVAYYFLEKPKNDDMIIHHIDTNKLNNKASNLIYCTNEEHRYIHKVINERINEIEQNKNTKKNTN